MRLVICTFAFLAFAFYEMSGGSDFDPVETRMARIELPAAEPVTETVLTAEATPERVEMPSADRDTTIIQASASPQTNAVVTPVSLNLRPVEFEPQAISVGEPVEVADQPTEVRLASLEPGAPQIILPSLVQSARVPLATDAQQSSLVTPAATPSDPSDIRAVTGSRVNVRGGPGTNFAVINQLLQGQRVEILRDPGDGWVMLRPVDGGPVGWMADFLLSDG